VRNVIVTGGSRGLGLAISTRLASTGYNVVAVARRDTNEFAAHRQQASAAAVGALHFRAFDLSDITGIPAFVATLSAEFGKWYGLVNNAGLGTSGVLATMHDNQIERLLRLNIASPIALTKYVVRAMMVGGGGRIVNMSSIVAGTGFSGLSVYSASKAALGGFSRSLARELGPLGITVNCVAPGFVDTDMTQELSVAHRSKIARRSALGRLPDPADVAGAVEYLLSDSARNVTGTTLTVDAGNTA
jgi:3-oxoacyl-[acyl-carrier protein] reductase